MPRYTSPKFHGGHQTPRVWAPNAQKMVHVIADGIKVPMRATGDGWWEAPEPLPVGTRYGFSVDGSPERPDPRSLLQPDGVNGLSEIVDLADYEWHDGNWQGVTNLQGAIIYELHIGTFTPDGTFDAAIEHLDDLVDLGVTHVEVMPVNGTPGARNWGYDGVNWYATQANYGGPHAFQRFVDGAHSRGLAVILDVVYNHLGPSGNYLPVFGPYFNEAHHTPWGAAINLDGPSSDEVRRFIIENALMWASEFHVDGFRLDAVHALADDTAIHLLEELVANLEANAEQQGCPITVIAESDRNDPSTVTKRRHNPMVDGEVTAIGGRTGYGLHAQWADDIHHALHVLLTGETQGYYEDFADPEAIEKVFRTPFYHDGTYSSFRGRRHGRSVDPNETPGYQFIASLQTHDQIGNRAAGDRLSALCSPGVLAAGAALLLTSPYTPMLFMGEEWGASTPWQFFTDHEDPVIAEATSKGRADEFAAHGWGSEVPDPQHPHTLSNSSLRWDERTQADHAQLLDWYKELIALRRTLPAFADPTLGEPLLTRSGGGILTLRRGEYRVVVNLSGKDVDVDGVLVTGWHTVTTTDAGVRLPHESVAILR